MGKERFLSKRQLLKVSAQVIAGFTIFRHFVFSPAIADDVVPPVVHTTRDDVFLQPVLDPSQFPNQLSFTDSLPSDRDQTRMLLFFLKPLPREDVTKLLEPTGLVLEDHDDVVGNESSLRHYRVNHGDRSFWVRSKNGEPITREMLKALDNATAGQLERIGPVYRVPRSTEPSGLYCPLPHVLVVKPQPKVPDEKLRKFFTSFNLQEMTDISTYLKGYRYLVLRDERDPTVYDLYLRFRAHDVNTIQSVLFDIMPLVSPLASSHDPNDFYFHDKTQWNMKQIQAGGISWQSGWELSKGNGIVVAVIDNGCDTGHEDLRCSNGLTLDFLGSQPQPQPPCRIPLDCPPPIPNGNGHFGLDNDQHGTQVAGIAGGIHNNNKGVAGTAGECTILSVRSANRLISERATAIPHAVNRGAKVINISWAENPYVYLSGMWKVWKDDIIDPNIKDAINAGSVICAATGTFNGPPIGYPASYDEFVIACGASTEIDGRYLLSPYGTGLSVVAPGENIVSTTIMGSGTGINGNYAPGLSGTSFATPHVAGLAAMLMSRFPLITPREVRRTIERTADKVNSMTYPYAYAYQTDTYPSGELRYPSGPWNEQVGYGRINCHHAVTFSDVYIKDCSTDSGEVPSCPPPGENWWSTSRIVVRPFDDGTFLPDNPLESSKVKLGHDNFVYVEVTNRGPDQALSFTVDARLVRYNMTEFTLDDWTGPIDSDHIQLDPLVVTFSNVAAGDSRLARFRLTQTVVDAVYGQMWHPCILARVHCLTDYSELNHMDFVTDSPQVRWLNNFAQRNVTFIQTKAGKKMKFPFMIGNPASASARIGRAMEIVIERKLHPMDRLYPPAPAPLPFPPAPARLFLDVDRSLFPTVKSLSRLDEIASRQRDTGTQIGPRSLEFDGPTASFHIVPLDTGRAALSLETEIPKTARPGQLFQTDISQRNRQGQVVGGVTVIYHVTE